MRNICFFYSRFLLRFHEQRSHSSSCQAMNHSCSFCGSSQCLSFPAGSKAHLPWGSAWQGDAEAMALSELLARYYHTSSTSTMGHFYCSKASGKPRRKMFLRSKGGNTKWSVHLMSDKPTSSSLPCSVWTALRLWQLEAADELPNFSCSTWNGDNQNQTLSWDAEFIQIPKKREAKHLLCPNTVTMPFKMCLWD